MILVNAEKRIAEIKDENEHNVANLILNMEFTFLECNQKNNPEIVKNVSNNPNLLNESVKVFVKHKKRGAPKNQNKKEVNQRILEYE